MSGDINEQLPVTPENTGKEVFDKLTLFSKNLKRLQENNQLSGQYSVNVDMNTKTYNIVAKKIDGTSEEVSITPDEFIQAGKYVQTGLENGTLSQADVEGFTFLKDSIQTVSGTTKEVGEVNKDVVLSQSKTEVAYIKQDIEPNYFAMKTSAEFIAASKHIEAELQNIKDAAGKGKNQGKTFLRKGPALEKSGQETLRLVEHKAKQRIDKIKVNRKIIEDNQKHHRNISLTDSTIGLLARAQAEIKPLKNDYGVGISGAFQETALRPNDSKEKIKASSREREKLLTLQEEHKLALRDNAILKLFNDDNQMRIDFLKAIVDGKMTPEQAKFFLANGDRFGQAFASDYVALYAQISSSYNKVAKSNPAQFRVVQKHSDYADLSYVQAMEKDGIRGLAGKGLDYGANLSTDTKNSWVNATKMVTGAAAIVGLGRLIFRRGKDKERHILRNLGITAGVGIGLNVISNIVFGVGGGTLLGMLRNGGFSLEALKNKAKNALSGFRDNNEYQYSQITNPLLINGLYGDLTFDQMEQKIQIWKKNPAAWKAEYEKVGKELGDTSFRKDWEQLGDVFNEKTFRTLLAGIGITPKLGDNTYISDTTEENLNNKQIFNKRIAELALKVPDDKAKQDEVTRRIAQAKDLEKSLDEVIKKMVEDGLLIVNEKQTHTERKEDTDRKKAMEAQVRKLGLNDTKTDNLIIGLNNFYDEHPIKDKEKLNFTLEKDGVDTVMKRNGRKIKIDLENATLPGFTDKNGEPFGFETYYALIKTAYQTHWQLDNAKKIAQEENGLETHNPFYSGLVATQGPGLYLRKTGIDPKVLSTAGAEKIFGQEKDKLLGRYAEYLNALRQKELGMTGRVREEDEIEEETVESVEEQENSSSEPPTPDYEKEFTSLYDKTTYIKSEISAMSLTDEQKVQTQEAINSIRDGTAHLHRLTTTLDNNIVKALHIADGAFTSYGIASGIDLQALHINGLADTNGHLLRFKNIRELLEMMNFLNAIKSVTIKIPSNFKKKGALTGPFPFSKIEKGNLQFNNDNLFEEFKKTIDISIVDFTKNSFIKDNANALISYLNDRHHRRNGNP